MENTNSTIDDHLSGGADLFLLPNGAKSLKTMANWCLFFAILGAIWTAFMLIAGLGMMTAGSAIPGMAGMSGIFGGVYLVLSIIYIAPIYFLFKFSGQMKEGLSRKDNHLFNEAFGKISMHFTIVGILTIVCIVIYIVFIGAMIGGGISAFESLMQT